MRQLGNLMTLWLCCVTAMLCSGCGETPAPKGKAQPVAPLTKDVAPQTSVAQTESTSTEADAPAGKTSKSSDDDQEMADDEEDMDADDSLVADKEPAEMDREELIAAMLEHLQTSILKRKKDDLEKSDAAIRESVRYAEELKRRFEDLESLERRVISMVFLHHARSLAQGETPQEAASAIAHAVDVGFDDLQQIEKDERFAKLRELPDYEQWRKDWEARVNELVAVEVQMELPKVEQQLAEFESYPFDFALPDLDDKEVKLADFQGKAVIVDIWGTWCPPCRDEIPSFVKLQEKYGEQGLQIVGLTYEQVDEKEDAVKAIREFTDEQPINYPLLIGDDATREQIANFEGFPTTLFIDRAGKVRLVYVGAESLGRLEATVLALLKDGNAASEPDGKTPPAPTAPESAKE